MTVVDRYIFNTKSRNPSIVARELGVSESFVKCRRMIIDTSGPLYFSINVSEEITALINLINERKTGWAVNAAYERISQLDKITRSTK